MNKTSTPSVLLTCIIILAGCGISLAKERTRQIDEDIKPYVYMFYFEWEKVTGVPHPVSEIKAVFVDKVTGRGIGENSIATCSASAMTLRFERGWWNDHGIVQREALVFHELGHCVLGRRGHISATFPCKERTKGCPTSIMFPEVLSKSVYSKYKTYYIRELFDEL